VRLPLHVSVHMYDHLQGAMTTRSHPESSSRHTYKPTVMTYGRILHKNTTNVHQRNPI